MTLVFKSPPDLPLIRKKLNLGQSFEDIVRTHLGGPLSVLIEDLTNLHRFRLDDIEVLKDVQILDPDYLRALYKMNIVSTVRVCKFVEEIQVPYVSSRIERLCSEGFYLFGVVFGSTGRFEATTNSDFEYTFIFYPANRTRLGRKEIAALRRILNEEIKGYIESEFSKWNEFKGSHICGINERSISRSWEYALKRKRTWACNYFLSYCFFQCPPGIFETMKRVYLADIGISNIIEKEYLPKVKQKKLDLLLKGKVPYIQKRNLKKLAINTIQALILLKLKDEAGHSLIDDVIKLWRKGELDKDLTKDILASILEVYKARWLDDMGYRYVVKDPTLLQGFKIALEHVKEMI